MSGDVERAKARLLELEGRRMSEGDMEEWRRLHRVIWGEGERPLSFLVAANVADELLFKTGLSLDEALRLCRVTLRSGAKAVTIQQLERA